MLEGELHIRAHTHTRTHAPHRTGPGVGVGCGLVGLWLGLENLFLLNLKQDGLGNMG